MKQLFDEAMSVAKNYDVSTPENALVLYSISFLPTKENKERAINFVNEHLGKVTIDNTICGKKLIEMGLINSDCGLTAEEMADIWGIASARMIQNASGEITAFVEKADPRSVFCRVELPNILKNPQISVINGEDKYIFAKRFSIQLNA